MGLRKKIFMGSALTLGTAAILLAGVYFLGPVFLNSPETKAKIRSSLSSAAGGKVDYARLDVALVPRPHLVFRELGISLRSVTGNIGALNVYPQIIPLLTRQVRIAMIVLEEPDLVVNLPRKKGPKTDAPEAGPLEELDEIKPALSWLETIGPGLLLQIDKGKLLLARENRELLSMRNLNAFLIGPPGEMTLSLVADSDDLGELSLDGAIFLGDTETTVRNLAITAGDSSLSGLTARLSGPKPHTLMIDSGKGSLRLDQIFGWLSSFPALNNHLKHVSAVKGFLSFSSLTFKGVPSRPASWEVETTGEAENVVLASELLPAPLSGNALFSIEGNTVAASNLAIRMGRSWASGVSGRFSWGQKSGYRIFSGKGLIDLEEAYSWRSWFTGLDNALREVTRLKGAIKLTSIKGTVSHDGASWNITTAGSVDDISLDSPLLPGTAAITGGSFFIEPGKILFQNMNAAVLDSAVTLSGSLSNFPKIPDAVNVAVKGGIGRDAMRWIFMRLQLPDTFIVRPLSTLTMDLQWNKTSGIRLAGKTRIADGPDISIELHRNVNELVVRRAFVKDQDSDASISYAARGNVLELSFSGTFAEATMVRIFEQSPAARRGKIQGDLQVKLHADNPSDSSAEGRLSGNDFSFPSGIPIPVLINSFSLHAEKKYVRIDSASITLGDANFSVIGDITVSKRGLIVDLDVDNDKVNINEIQTALKPVKKEEKQQAAGGTNGEHDLTVKNALFGMIELESSSLTFGRFIFSPFKTLATFGPPGISAAITEAEVCGVSTPGNFSVFKGQLELALNPSIKKQPIAYSISCLAGLDVHITGTYDLTADIRMKGNGDSMVSSLEGSIDFLAKDGKIYRAPTLAKIFSVLSVTEIFRGKTPVLGGSGFPYKTLALKGNLQQGKLRLQQAYLIGSSVDLVAEGSVDFTRKKMDLVVLVAPFSTLNWIVRHIPLIGKLLGGTLISIPVKVSGDFGNPEVVFLDPSTVGSRIVNLFKNIIRLPVEIISPFIEKDKKNGK